MSWPSHNEAGPSDQGGRGHLGSSESSSGGGERAGGSNAALTTEGDTSRDRLRLPPLSTLISGSPQAHSSALRSPLIGHHSASSSSYPHYSTAESSHHRLVTAEPFSNFYPPRHHQPPSDFPRRASSASAAPVNLPPLTSLSLQSRASRSPSSASSALAFAEPQPPRLPSMSLSPIASAAATSSDHRRQTRGPFDYTSSSSTHFGPTRRRMNSASTYSRPYQRPSEAFDHEYFGHIWDIYSYAFRINEEFSPTRPRSFPSIANGDVKSLIFHLNRELDLLERRDPDLSHQLAQDAGLMGNQVETFSSSSHYRLGEREERIPMHRDERERPIYYSSARSFTSPAVSYYSGLPALPRLSDGEGSGSSSRRRLSKGGSPSAAHHHHRPPISSPPSQQQNPLDSYHQHSSIAATSTSVPPKRVRKRKDEADQSCLSCSATETPEWRKGPTGPRTLCNACGLLFAKQCRKKELEAQARGERPRGSRPLNSDTMTAEEKEKSLMELKLAVNARLNSSPLI